MLLKVKSLNLVAGKPIAILHEKTAKKLAIYVGERVRLKNKKEIIAVVDIAKGLLKENEVVISKEIMDEMGIFEGYALEVNAAPRPRSAEHIYEKLNGKELSYVEILEIMQDIVGNALTEAEIAYFISGIYVHGMSEKETVNLTKAMVATGKTISIPHAVDKHSIGGIAGNRTTPIVVSICSAAGLRMPKTSSRAITSAAGTADVMECFTRVEFSIPEIKEIVKKVNACLVWGGALNLAPADDKIIQVERILGLDPEVQLLASILSKKIAIGAKHVLIDIPYGKSAKVDRKKGEALARRFERVGSLLGLKIKTVLTDGSQPIGNGIGPILEAKDVYAVLARKDHRPLDLERKAIFIAAQILEMTHKARKGEGEKLARTILESRQAFSQFMRIINAQDGMKSNQIESRLKHANLSFTFNAAKSGTVREISNRKIASIAFSAGCPADRAAGLYLYVHNGFKVKKGDPLLTVHAETEQKLKFAKDSYKELKPIILR